MPSRYINTPKGSSGKSEKRYPGNYVGIVIQNNDPEHSGKIKVWIPHISNTVYSNWVQSDEKKKFKFPGDNIGSDLTEIIDELKDILPWAEPAMPIIGPSSSGRYNAHNEVGSISDSSRPEEIKEKQPYKKTDYSLNKDGIGEKPARVYEVDELKVNDAFNSTKDNNTNRVNKYSYNYKPSSYSNRAKGSFSIPNVGAHLWVFFKGGDPQCPVYFASCFGGDDWKGIYDLQSNEDRSFDYPGTYENVGKRDDPAYNHNTETYRNKYVLNQKGGTFEIVNTDNKEILKMTHFKGSFLEFNNDTTIQFAVGNDQKLVTEDQYLTVKGFKNEWIERDLDFLCRGDHYIKVGNHNIEAHKEWKAIMDDIAEYKQLFDIKRVHRKTINDTKNNEILNRISGHQEKSGTHTACPLCSYEDREEVHLFNNVFYGYTPVNSTASGGTGSVLAGDWIGSTGGGSDTDDDSDDFSSVSTIGSLALSGMLIPTGGNLNFLGGMNCPCCGGLGESPSSEGGVFDVEDKQNKVVEKLRDVVNDLTNWEKKMGIGGSQIVNITKHKIETIGLLVNDFPAVRIDPIGKISKNEVVILPEGVVNNQRPSGLIELVHVDDLPGGSYNLNVGNRYNVQVGAGGVTMKSMGPVNISGAVTNIAGDQVNIGSEYEINLCTEGRLNIVADILTLRQKNYKQVMVDSNLGVSQNVVVGGGMHVEGELSVQHVTAPCEMQQTEIVEQAVKLITGVGFHCTISGGTHRDAADSSDNHPNWSDAVITFTAASSQANNEDIGYTTPHSHQFRNLPLTLMQSNNDVRTMAEPNNLPSKGKCEQVRHEKKIDKSTGLHPYKPPPSDVA